MELSNLEIRNILNKALRGLALTQEERQVLNFSEEGIEAPKEIKTELLDSKRVYKSMKQFVDVIPVNLLEGRYSTEDEASHGELEEFDSNNPIPLIDDDFKGVYWKCISRGAITPFSSTLYKDSAFDLVEILRKSYGKKSVRTENRLIFKKLKEGIIPETITEQAFCDSLDTDLDPSLETEHVIVTNQTGLKKIKKFGNYHVIETSNGPKRFIDIYPLEVFSDKTLPNEAENSPVFYGSFKQSIKFFEYGKIRLDVTSVAQFLQDNYLIRGITSFNVQKFGTADYQYKLI